MRTPRRFLALPVAALALGMLLFPSTSALAERAPTPAAASAAHQNGRLIVRTGSKPKVIRAVDAAITQAGGRVLARQPGLGMLVAEGPASLVETLARIDGVSVAHDRSLKVSSLGFDPATQPGSMTNVTAVTGATGMWKSGYTGKGVDVALVDTGVAPVPGLSASTKVVVGPDLSFESQNPDARYLDSYGHGSHMAGIIAGRETAEASGSTYAADKSNFYGMAPDARLVSVKVADHDGVVDVSQVIAAIDWVAQFGRANGLNVRVLNLSLGLDSPQNPLVDPLSWAAEVAWTKGIVVVASAGNNGDSYPGLNSPAADPRIIAVGAVDAKGTASVTDDTIPSFSAVQGGNFGNRGPDLVAPGVGIVSLRVPGSSISDNYPAAKVANNYLRGSGTSQAAAVVSGAAALLLQQRPGLTPDQVKALLMNSATSLSGVSTGSQGKGELNLSAAAAAAVPTSTQPVIAATGDGSIESARGGRYVSMDGQTLQGEYTVWGQWAGPQTAPKTANASMWSADGTTWNGSVISGAGFTSDTTSVAGRTWAGRTWAGRTWAGSTWTGRTWAGLTWTGRTWANGTWTAGTWQNVVTANGWAANAWATGSWK